MKQIRARIRELEASGFPTHTAITHVGLLQQLQDTRYTLRRQLQEHVPDTGENF
jgi:hypothetical protein